MEALIAKLREYLEADDWISAEAQRALATVSIYQSGELNREATLHNLRSIITQKYFDLQWPELEKKLALDNTVFLISEQIVAEENAE
jgi:hypothetical protein